LTIIITGPVATCFEVQRELTRDMYVLENPTKTDLTLAQVNSKLSSDIPLEDKIEIALKFNAQSEKIGREQDTLDRFRKVVFDSMTIHIGDEAFTNHHIKPVEFEELGRDEVLERTKPILKALEDITGNKYDPTIINIHLTPNKNCPQRP
jgi:hypothetical protein